MSNNTTIRFSRSSDVLQNLDSALLALDLRSNHIGEPMMVNYYDSNDEVKSIVAIGTSDGRGRSSYSVLSTAAGTSVINGIRDGLVDVTSLVNGEVFLSKYDGNWNLFTSKNGERVIKQVTISPSVFYDLSTGWKWYYIDGDLKRETDFVVKDEVDSILSKGLNEIKVPEISITSEIECKQEGETLSDPEISILVKDYSGADITDNVVFKIYSDKTITEEIRLKATNHVITIPGDFKETDTIYFVAEYSTDDFTVYSETSKLVIYFQNPIYHCSYNSVINDDRLYSYLFNLNGSSYKYTIEPDYTKRFYKITSGVKIKIDKSAENYNTLGWAISSGNAVYGNKIENYTDEKLSTLGISDDFTDDTRPNVETRTSLDFLSELFTSTAKYYNSESNTEVSKDSEDCDCIVFEYDIALQQNFLNLKNFCYISGENYIVGNTGLLNVSITDINDNPIDLNSSDWSGFDLSEYSISDIIKPENIYLLNYDYQVKNTALWSGEGKIELPELKLSDSSDIIFVPYEIELENIYDESESTFMSEYDKITIYLDNNVPFYNIYVRKEKSTETLYLILASEDGAKVLVSGTDKNTLLKEIRSVTKAEIKNELTEELLEILTPVELTLEEYNSLVATSQVDLRKTYYIIDDTEEE